MIQRMIRQVIYEMGNGRALDNARRATERDRAEHERIEAAVGAIVERAGAGAGEEQHPHDERRGAA